MNVWVSVSENMANAVTAFEESGALPSIADLIGVVEFLTHTQDHRVVRNLFKCPEGRCLFSVYPNDDTAEADLQNLALHGGGDAIIMGAWYSSGEHNGLQLGQEQGDPTYPISDDLMSFMPDDIEIVEGIEPGDEQVIATPATELKQVNLLEGQAPRDFTSADD